MADTAYRPKLIAAYRRIRPVIQHGRQYWLRAPEDDGLTALQYVSPDGDRAVTFAWLQAPHFGQTQPPLRLTGLDSTARYREESTGALHHGAVLLAHGLPLPLPHGDYASCAVELTRID